MKTMTTMITMGSKDSDVLHKKESSLGFERNIYNIHSISPDLIVICCISCSWKIKKFLGMSKRSLIYGMFFPIHILAIFHR